MTTNRKINHYLTNALAEAFMQIWDYQQDGYCTEQDVINALSGWDIVEEYRGWLAG